MWSRLGRRCGGGDTLGGGSGIMALRVLFDMSAGICSISVR